MSHSRVRRSLVPALAATALLALAGCGGGVTDAATSPSVAAHVGDVDITQQRVDRTAEALCADIEDQLIDAASPVAMVQIRQYALSVLATRAQAEQVAEDYDVTAGPEVTQGLNEWKQQADSVPEDLVDDFATAMSTEALVTSVLSRVGEASLRAEGVTRPAEDAVMQRGSELFGQWAEQNDVTFDPRYGLETVDGRLQSSRGATSFPVSERATQAWSDLSDPENPDTDYAASLPESQRCG